MFYFHWASGRVRLWLFVIVIHVCGLFTGEDHAVFWNHGSSVLSMNERVFVPHRLVSVTSGDNQPADTAAGSDDLVVYTLRLDSITLEDEGEYTCQVPSQPSLIQRHRIVVNGQSKTIFPIPLLNYSS